MPRRHEGSAGDYPGRFLGCRGVAHTWVHPDGHWSVTTKRGRFIEFRRTLQCSGCGAERVDTFDADMRPVRTARRYPEGYLTTKQNRVDGAAARLEQVRRLGTRPGARLEVIEEES